MNDVFWTQFFGFLIVVVGQVFSHLRLKNEAKKIGDKADEAGTRAVKATQVLRGDIAENTKITSIAAKLAAQNGDDSREEADKLSRELQRRADEHAAVIEAKVEEAKQSMESLMDFMAKRARAAAERKGVVQ